MRAPESFLCCPSSTHDAHPTLKRHLLLLPALVLFLVALWSGVGQLSFLRDDTAKQDWLSAARRVRKHILPTAKEAASQATPSSSSKSKKNSPRDEHLAAHPLPADRILVWPAWRETPLPELVEVSQALMWNDQPVLEDLQGARRLFLLTPTSRVEEALDELPFPARPHITSREDFDTVQLLEIAVPKALTQWPIQLSDHLAEATVEIIDRSVTPHKRSRCSKRARAGAPSWSCPDLPEQVGVSFYELDDQPRYCILAPPPKGKETALRVTFPSTSLEDASNPATLRFRAGFDLRGARLAANNDDLTLKIFIADQEIARQRYQAQTSTWKATDIELAPQALEGAPQGLTFEVDARSATHKLFCFNAWLGSRPAPSNP